jgi:hypothetical protein
LTDINQIYETLGNLKINLRVEPKKFKYKYDNTNYQAPKYIYQDEKTGQIKERLLSSAGAAIINQAQLIHDFMFG